MKATFILALGVLLSASSAGAQSTLGVDVESSDKNNRPDYSIVVTGEKHGPAAEVAVDERKNGDMQMEASVDDGKKSDTLEAGAKETLSGDGSATTEAQGTAPTGDEVGFEDSSSLGLTEVP